MTERLLILALIIAVLAIAWLALRLRSWRFRRRNARDVLTQFGIHEPLVLAFSTPECVPCRMQQRPALHELLRRYPNRMAVREVDATVDPALADRFGIMTVPSTVVVDARGRIIAINHGVARWERLAAQLSLNGTDGTRRSREITVRRTDPLRHRF